MLTLRAAAQLLVAADSLDALAPLIRPLGFADDWAALDERMRRQLGIDLDITEARIATGRGALRAFAVEVPEGVALRERLPKLAARLASRAPHLLWLLIAVQPATKSIAIAAWMGDRRPPRVAALIVHRARVVDSDAESLRALAAAADGHDVLNHARWVEVLGRDALSARFYRALESAIGGLAASSRAGGHAVRRELALLDTSRLLFLSFLEAKGWLDGDARFLARQFEHCMERHGGFRIHVLRPLFFGTLNTPAPHRAPAARAFGRIPFLNGGLFARTPLERRCRDVVCADDAYGALLFDVFGQFRFTAREETSAWTEAAVDPEMLGRSFERLMASRERRITGAFFTPFSLVERVTQCALDSTPLDTPDALARITVLDPACGSGGFLVHALERLADRARALGDERPLSAIRRTVLTRSIFGVDINPTAVWLCQLRLWLSVVIESDERDPTAVMPLPNLDRNIRVGDALRGRAFDAAGALPRGGAVLARLRERYSRATGARKESLARELERAERGRALASIDAELRAIAHRRRDLVVARRGRDLFGGRYRASRDERSTAAVLRRSASALRTLRRAIVHGGALPFSFSTHFGDIAARGGFALVVGNPPWVRLHRIPAADREAFRRDFLVARRAAWESGAASAGMTARAGFASQIDMAALFIERSGRLLAPGGALALLVPAKVWRSLAGGGVRRLLAGEMDVLRLEDYSEARAAFDAAVYPSLVVARRAEDGGSGPGEIALAVHRRSHGALQWCAPKARLAFDESCGAPWIMLPHAARDAFDRLRQLNPSLAHTAFGRPLLGVKCGCNDAFLVELIDVRGDVAVVVGSSGSAIEIERELVRPLIRGEMLQRWCVPSSDESIVWTHGVGGTPLVTLPALASRWFSRWRRVLMARADARHRARWWSLFRIESARHDRPRVVWADVGKELRASVLPAGDPRVPLNTCYVVRCRDECDAHALAALLNGPIARAWLDALAEPARGGYRRYLGWTLSLLPIPSAWDAARQPLAELGARGARGEVVTDAELLDASIAAYGISHDVVSPLLEWGSV